MAYLQYKIQPNPFKGANVILEWLKNRGTEKSRYTKYKSYIDKISPSLYLDLEYTFKESFKEATDAYQEFAQIAYIYKMFKDENSKEFNRKLKIVTSGKDFYVKQSQDQPRDYLYELLIAARFKNSGFSINFNENTDVIASKDNIDVYIECKRIKSSKRLEENLKKACKQLENITESTSQFKIVFIDIYNCVAEYLKDYPYSNVIEMKNEFDNILEKHFREPNAKKIDEILMDHVESILGVTFTINRVLWFKDEMNQLYPQFYQDLKGVTAKNITPEKFYKFKTLLECIASC